MLWSGVSGGQQHYTRTAAAIFIISVNVSHLKYPDIDCIPANTTGDIEQMLL